MIDSEKISSRVFAFSVAGVIQSSVLLTSLFIDMVRQDSWIIVLLGMFMVVPFILMYSFIMKNYPDKNLFQVLEKVFGRVIGKIISLFYLYFFFQLTSLNLNDVGSFINSALMPNTPLIIVMLITMSVIIYAVKGGISVITKYAAALVVIVVVVFLLAALLTLNIIDLKNFLPVFEYSIIKYVQGTHIVTTIPFAEIVIFLMVTPNIKIKPENIKKFFFTGILIGALTLLLVVTSSIALLGENLYLYTIPPFEMFTLINITSALSRMEILSAIAILILLFFKISILFYVTVVAISYFFNLSSYKPLARVLGIIVVIYASFIYDSMIIHTFLAANITIFIWFVFEFVFPLAIVIGTKVKNKLQKAIAPNSDTEINNEQQGTGIDNNSGKEAMAESVDNNKGKSAQSSATQQII